jgi:hypothetical protein
VAKSISRSTLSASRPVMSFFESNMSS